MRYGKLIPILKLSQNQPSMLPANVRSLVVIINQTRLPRMNFVTFSGNTSHLPGQNNLIKYPPHPLNYAYTFPTPPKF